MKNNRTFLEKLLDGAEVEWKTLGDVCNFQNGFAFKSSLFKDNGSPIVRITNIDGGRVNLSDVKYFLMDDYNTDMVAYEVHKDDILIAMSGATTGKIGFYNYEHTSYLNQRVGKFLPNTNILNNRYLYHYLLSKVEDIYIISGGGAQPNLSSNRLMSEVLIPIPPLPVQTEIVKILDALTALTSELTSELILRQKQYEYYREKLLSEEELGKVGFEWKTLGDVAKIQRGASPRPISQYITDDPNGIPWIKIGDTSLDSKYIENTAQKITIEGAEKSRILKSGDFVMSNSMSYGRPYILKISGAIHDGWASISNFGNILNSDFLYYYLSSNTVQSYWNGKINSSSVSNLNSDIIKSLSIPIPTLNIQIEIAKTLDKFETLTNSITKGLPLAIEQSQKRYEYYRELLLNFPGRE